MKNITKEENHVVPDELLSKEFLSRFETGADVSKFPKQWHAQVFTYFVKIIPIYGLIMNDLKNSFILLFKLQCRLFVSLKNFPPYIFINKFITVGFSKHFTCFPEISDLLFLFRHNYKIWHTRTLFFVTILWPA